MSKFSKLGEKPINLNYEEAYFTADSGDKFTFFLLIKIRQF